MSSLRAVRAQSSMAAAQQQQQRPGQSRFAAILPYIQASVPVLREHGLTITKTFYKNMFDAHPELKNLFNMGNQASGVQQQSLGSALFAYAANIEQAAALAPVVTRIAHKHAAVGIKPVHYPIVARHLLGAIKEVLGEAATPDLLSAWDEAYWLLAGELIAAESRLYLKAGAEAGVLREMRVTGRREESSEVTSFTLQTKDGSAVGGFAPGQYVSVEVNLPGGLRQLRQYSLSDAVGKDSWRISVKRESGDAAAATPAGAVSNWLHDNIRVGDSVKVSPPFGDFTPPVEGDGKIVLLSAGIGITPMLSVLSTIAKRNPQRSVLFAHAARHGGVHAHRDEVRHLRSAMPNLRLITAYETPRAEDKQGVDFDYAGRLALLKEQLPADASYHMCGPIGFMREQWKALVTAGVPVQRIEREVFGPELLDHLL